MDKDKKLVIEACILSLKATLGNMPSGDADRVVQSVIQILVSLNNQ